MNVKKFFSVFNMLIFILLCSLFISVFFLVNSQKPIEKLNKELQNQQSTLAIRAIGNDLLTSVGDFEPLLPIKQVASTTYRLKFRNSIVIHPDSLVAYSLKHIKATIAMHSIINVLDAKTEEIVYSFEINHLDENNIPCLERILPNSGYWIDVHFYNSSNNILGKIIPVFFIVVTILLLLLVFFKTKKKDKENENQIVKGFKIVSYLNQITFNKCVVQLTNKEMQIFSILLKKEGALVTRDYLIEEVWLKEGLVTSRSLDMYISRLRKKISEISEAQIINQHGKGYILEI